MLNDIAVYLIKQVLIHIGIYSWPMTGSIIIQGTQNNGQQYK